MAGILGPWSLALTALLGAFAPPSKPPPLPPPGTSINGHPVRVDDQGMLLSWMEDESPYGRVVDITWDAFLHRFPVEANGERTYVTYSRFDPDTLRGVPWPHNPAGLYAMLTDSALAYYTYAGNEEVRAKVRALLDYQLEHGTTPAGWAWAEVPFASATAGELEYTGGDDDWCDHCGRGDGVGVLEPDKVGELGLAYVRFHESTGGPRYLRAGVACADALAANIRRGDRQHSPWPFRVVAKTGEPREPYTANVLGAIELFDELVRIGAGDVAAYQDARAAAWQWLMAFPMRNDAWSGYFEDIVPADDPDDNPNQYIASRVAEYLLNHPYEATSREQVPHLIDWIRKSFAIDTDTERGRQWGAEVLSEQRADMAKMGSHTARYAALMALYFERKGGADAAERAFRSFNWASYMTTADGIVTVGEDKQEGYWFSDGYGDYIRHFLKGMASYPAWAPPHEDHLLRTSSVITHVVYTEDSIRYETFDAESDDRLTLSRPPLGVTVGGVPIEETGGAMDLYRLEGGALLLELSRDAPGEVVIALSDREAREGG